jgi:hypothetical protein
MPLGVGESAQPRVEHDEALMTEGVDHGSCMLVAVRYATLGDAIRA